MRHPSTRGFTLIELLVVIAIIGILSAVVLASLSTARTKGQDAAVRSDLESVRTQAAIYLAQNSDYGTFDNGSGSPGTCPATGVSGSTVFHDPVVARAIASALGNAQGGATFCMANGSAYAVAVSRPDTTNSSYWCVDSTGVSCGVNSLTGPSCGTCASNN